jgi:pimeloyl-ACP methyl ester carboxylesterase
VRVERIAEASHWVQADAPEQVNQLMVDFLLEHMDS